MKKITLLILPILLFASCVNDDTFPKIENITKGTKWTLQIGSNPAEVYTQLQELGLQKNFSDVTIAYKQPFLNPKEIKSDLSLYKGITLQASTEPIARILIQFDKNKVKSIEKGGGLLEPITKWPDNMSDKATIHQDDAIVDIQSKLVAIYQNATFENYKIILSPKWLERPFDPEMAANNEWHFSFNTDITSSKSSSSSVSLFFSNAKLVKIQHVYSEASTMN